MKIIRENVLTAWWDFFKENKGVVSRLEKNQMFLLKTGVQEQREK